jgi:alpha-ketoglutarate-dependent taurine dioxygenase
MRIENIHDSWGSKIYLDSPQEFFNYSFDYWRNLIYERKIIIFKTVDFTLDEYIKFGSTFGKPWKAEDYTYSNEDVQLVGNSCVSPFSSNSKKLGMTDMPWHTDIPNRDYKPHPFRSLWIVSNPLPEISGITGWLNLELALDYLTPEMKELLPCVSVVQQSWYEPGTDTKEFPLLKTHPVTGKQSLRLNYFNWLTRKDAWITDVKIDGQLQPDCSLINNWLLYLEKKPELIYRHTWDTKDIAIYDNWTFVHSRTRLIFNNSKEIRKFYRINIDHLDEKEWEEYKNASNS